MIRSLIDDDQGQATTEYIVLLTMSMLFLVTVTTKLITPAYKKLTLALSNNIEQRVFGSDMHHFRVRR